MIRFVPAVFCLCLLSSCEIETLIQEYDEGWRLQLNNDFSEQNPGYFSGLSTLNDGSILIVYEAIGSSDGSELNLLQVSPDGNMINSGELLITEFDIDIRNPSVVDQVQFLNSTVSAFTERAILQIDQSLSSEITSIEPELLFESLTITHLGVSHFYIGGFSNNRDNFLISKNDFTGEVEWTFSLGTLRPLEILEGTDGVIFVLAQLDSQNQYLFSISQNGELEWSHSLNNSEGIFSRLREALSIYGSPSNTTSLIGNSDTDNLFFGIVGPRGSLVLQRNIRDFTGDQVEDFLVTQDGGYTVVLLGDDLTSPMFTVLRLNHAGEIAWQQDYDFPNPSSDLQLIELVNKDIIVLSGTGELIQLIPD